MELTFIETVIGMIVLFFASIGMMCVAWWGVNISEARRKRKEDREELIDTMDHSIKYLKRRWDEFDTSTAKSIKDVNRRLDKIEKILEDE